MLNDKQVHNIYEETLKDYMHIHANMPDLAEFDPRLAVLTGDQERKHRQSFLFISKESFQRLKAEMITAMMMLIYNKV